MEGIETVTETDRADLGRRDMNALSGKLKGYADRWKTERERIKKDVEKEDFLLTQIDEFREKAKQLQGLLALKEDKVQELKEIVAKKEDKAKELSDIIEERQDAADRIAAGVKEQIEGMVEKVDAKLNELNETFAERLAENAANSAEQHEEVRTLIEEHNTRLTETIEGLNGQFDDIKNDIYEKIHTEDVKCYRNMQALIEESDKKIEEIRSEVSEIRFLKSGYWVIMIFVQLNFVGVIVLILRALGII